MLSPARLLPFLLLSLVACGKAPVAGLGLPGDTRDGGSSSTRDARIDPRDGGETSSGDAGSTRDGGFDALDAGPISDGAVSDSGTADAGPITDGGHARDGGVMTPRDGGVMTPRDGGPPRDGGVECLAHADCAGIGPTDYCDPNTFTCVECLTDGHCRFNDVCDVAHGNVCRDPCFNGNCRPGQICDTQIDVCVDCLTDAECDGGELCHPTLRECVECTSNADCALAPNQPFCDTADNECVGCLSDGDCAMGEVCYPYQGRFCATPTNRGICEPCIADGECGGADDLCIGYASTGGLFDRSCSPGCAVDADCPRGWDCVSVRQNDNVCRPRYDMNTPTCTAERNLGQMCRFDPQSVDPGCGLLGVQDARCFAGGPAGNGTCTIWCDSNDDCPTGTSCLTLGQTQVCL